MKRPIKRRKIRYRECPIDIDSLHRRWERGDERIDWPRIEKLYHNWLRGELVPWRKLSPTFIKKGPRPIRRQRRNREHNWTFRWNDNGITNEWFYPGTYHYYRPRIQVEEEPAFPIDLVYDDTGYGIARRPV